MNSENDINSENPKEENEQLEEKKPTNLHMTEKTSLQIESDPMLELVHKYEEDAEAYLVQAKSGNYSQKDAEGLMKAFKFFAKEYEGYDMPNMKELAIFNDFYILLGALNSKALNLLLILDSDEDEQSNMKQISEAMDNLLEKIDKLKNEYLSKSDRAKEVIQGAMNQAGKQILELNELNIPNDPRAVTNHTAEIKAGQYLDWIDDFIKRTKHADPPESKSFLDRFTKQKRPQSASDNILTIKNNIVEILKNKNMTNTKKLEAIQAYVNTQLESNKKNTTSKNSAAVDMLVSMREKVPNLEITSSPERAIKKK